MKVPSGQVVGNDSGGLGASALVVILVLMLGAAVFLWKARYIRRGTAYVLIAILSLAIAGIGVWTYSHPM